MVLLSQTRETQLGYTLSLEDYATLSETDRTHFLHDFVYQSNYIEGISDHYGHTIPKGAQVTIPPELKSHEKAFDLVVQNALSKKHPNAPQICKLHKTLTEGLLCEEDRGHLRRIKVRTTLENGKIKQYPTPDSLPYLIKSFQESLGELAENPTVTQEDLLENHAYFEWIHPFVDGNGRTGRLLLNWLSLAHRKEFYVIESGKRQEYFQFLQSLEDKFNKKHQRITTKLTR